jgi:hypothetical protein
MLNYQRINNLMGWLVFAISAVVYTLTLEPTTSFWDCGEFISACYKMQVMHPPGAPFFMLTGRMFTLFASDPSQVAWTVNFLSGITSAFTILFLFWSITAFGRKMLEREGEVKGGSLIALMGAGLVGALAYTFTDSFWFSAVEGEVYAYSSFFTAVVFWAILKWERVADEADSNRWLILIAYLMGLSIGVHLLNLLAIPAICFVYYFRKFEPSRKGVIYTLLISGAILGFVQYGVIPGITNIAAYSDLFFVNSLGMGFGSGAVFFCLLVVAAVAFGIWYTHKQGKVLLNSALLALSFIIMGYGTYAMIVIRSASNPPIDMNNPENVFSLLSYLNREQYGDRPLLYGPYFTAQVIDQKEGKMRYRKGDKEYIETGRDIEAIYDPAQSTLLPRAYRRAGTQQRHIDFYKQWLDLRDGQKPTFADNMDFLFSYQLGHMYFRYFMWNFAGRQNDIQGQGMDYERGNWITGIPFIDEGRIGPQKDMPEIRLANKGRNVYYALPLLLGLVGLWYQYRKDRKDFWVVTMLFVLTGIAINVYLNPEPLQPRERDYAYVGSFYAFAMWIGLGVLGLFELLRKRLPETVVALGVTAITLVAVPGILAAENWDDHDRSGKYTARDFAINYLESCAPNAILFTMGDNDTYPLWYAQEVEGIRTDVRIVNLSLLGTDWYIDQLRRPMNASAPIKLSVPQEKIAQGIRDYVPFYDRKLEGAYDLKQIIAFMTNDDPQAKLPTQGGELINYYPTKNFVLPVVKNNVVAQGAMSDTSQMLDAVIWEYPRTNILKNDLIVLDLLAQNMWERPIYWTISMGPESYMGLEDYFQLEGLTYRLVPFRTPSQGGQRARVATDIMYKNFMEKFKWGGMDKGIYIDPETSRMTINLRSNSIRLAESLLAEGKKEQAANVLLKADQVMPHPNVPYMLYNYRIVELLYNAGKTEEATKMAKTLFEMYEQEAKYFTQQRGKVYTFYERDLQNAMAIMNELIRITRGYAQNDLAADFEKRFKVYGGNPQMPG